VLIKNRRSGSDLCHFYTLYIFFELQKEQKSTFEVKKVVWKWWNCGETWNCKLWSNHYNLFNLQMLFYWSHM